MATTKTTKKALPVRQPLKREPTHPGEILREDVLPALRMNVSQAARELDDGLVFLQLGEELRVGLDLLELQLAHEHLVLARHEGFDLGSDFLHVEGRLSAGGDAGAGFVAARGGRRRGVFAAPGQQQHAPVTHGRDPRPRRAVAGDHRRMQGVGALCGQDQSILVLAQAAALHQRIHLGRFQAQAQVSVGAGIHGQQLGRVRRWRATGGVGRWTVIVIGIGGARGRGLRAWHGHGCGDGTTAVPAARHGAEVLGVDIARNLIEAGKKRARAEGLTNLTFQEGDATNLQELNNNTFDLAISIFGAMFAPKPFDVAKEMVRVTKALRSGRDGQLDSQ